MGALDQYAKGLWDLELELSTNHALSWTSGVEITISHNQLDGVLTPLLPAVLLSMVAPWNIAASFGSIVLDFKMQGDHVTSKALALLEQRRANWVAELYKQGRDNQAEKVGCWLVHSHLSRELEPRSMCVAMGCYEIDNSAGEKLLIAANELPLHKELIPLLVAREGNALVEFGLWLLQTKHRTRVWVQDMLMSLPMSPQQRMALLNRLPPDEKIAFLKQQMQNARDTLEILATQDPSVVPEIMQVLTPEQRLEGLAPQQRLEGLAPQQRLEGLAPEQRLEGLDAAHAVLALPDEVLKVLPQEYVETLPDDVRQRIRQRLG